MNNTSHINRRGFLARGAAAAGTVLASSDALSAPKPQASIVPEKKLVGCLCSLDEILNQPTYIDALQKKLGVNMILCSPPIKMPDWLLNMNPLGEERTMHTRHTDDDSNTHKAIEETHSRGMEFWCYFSGHHYPGKARNIVSETFDGVNFIDLPPIKYSLEYEVEKTICFAKPVVKEYETAAFSHAARTYNVDSMWVTHYRYANPSFWTNLFGCACRYCQEEAEGMGYDFPRMKEAMMSLLRRLKNLDRKTLEHAAKFRLTFIDFLTLLGEDNGIMDWLVFRAKVVGKQLKRIHDAVHTITNDRSKFITDTHGTTLSLLVGHNWEDFIAGSSDALNPLSWCAYHYISPVAAWANQLCEWVPGLEEATALKLVISLFGWDELGLPDKKITDLEIGESSAQHRIWQPGQEQKFYAYFNPDLTIKLMTHEWTRMSAINHGRIPTYPVIKGYEWPEKVCRELMNRADDLGLSGYLLQRTDVFIDRAKL